MGNSLIFPAPKCTYTSSSLQPFYLPIPVVEEYQSSKLFPPKAIKQNIPTLHIRSSFKSKYLIIYFHGNSCDLGRMFPGLLEYYEHFQVTRIRITVSTTDKQIRSIYLHQNTLDTASIKDGQELRKCFEMPNTL